MNNQLLAWRKCSTKEQWADLAKKSGTSPGYLNLIAYVIAMLPPDWHWRSRAHQSHS